MGAVIERGAAALDVMADVKTTLVKAGKRATELHEPRWQALAEGRLGRHLTLWTSRQAALTLVDEEVAEKRATVGAVDTASDQGVVLLREKIWNLAGRPGPNDDPNLDLLFPDGSDTYAEETLEGTPDALDFLVELLLTVGHPKIDPAVLAGHAAEITALAQRHRAAGEALRKPLARQKLLGKACTAIAKSARIQLVKLKRAYELEGFSEAAIHEVIPDRSGPAKKAVEPVPALPAVG